MHVQTESTASILINERTSPRFGVHIARITSDFLSPPILGLLMNLLIGVYIGKSTAYAWIGAHSFATVVIPTAYIVLLLQQGDVGDIHLRRREERIRPLMLTTGLHALSMAVMTAFKAPPSTQALAAITLVHMLLHLGITLVWKVSGHTSAITMFSVLAAVLTAHGIWMLAAIPLVAWARIKLQRHTWAQVAGGMLLGAGNAWLLASLLLNQVGR